MLIKSDYKPQMRQKPVKQKKPVSTNGRIAFVLLVFATAFAAAAGWSIHLHTVEQNRLQTEGNKRFVRTLAAVSELICRFKNTKSLLVRARRSAMVSTGTSMISESCSSCS